jgi:hypothetical protein
MAEELGKIEKPEAEKFLKGRKLFFVPLIFTPPETEPEFTEKVTAYWDQVEEHVRNLESKLGEVTRIFHELVPVGGDEGSKVIQQLNDASYQFALPRMIKGAEVQPLEDTDLLTQFMDWSRCLAIGLQNQTVIEKIYELYSEVHSNRNEAMAKNLDDALKEDEIGILLMREGHHVQFPSDIQVFYVSPPGLDELKRWFREREAELEAALQRELESAAGKSSEEDSKEDSEG